MQDEIRKNLRHNYIVNLLDGGFFGFGIGFSSFSTILPLFFSQMTSSATLIGLIPAIHNMGWQLPQLLTANRILKLRRLKPWVSFWTIHERFPFVALGIIALLLPKLGAPTALLLSFICLIWQGLGAGITANAWQNMIGKVIPSDMRATFFGAQSSAANLLASLGAFIAGIILENVLGPNSFAICFFICGFLMAISWFFLYNNIEPDGIVEDCSAPQPLLRNISNTLSKDHNFTWFLVSRMVFQFGTMAFAFYTVYAVSQLKMQPFQAGIMTSVLLITQMIANPLLGRLADRWSRQGVLALGSIACALSPIAAYLATDISWFYLVFVMAGIANTAFWTIGMAITMEFGTEAERPTYVGMANTLIAPSAILAPLLGGWLADHLGYRSTFFVAALLALLTTFILLVFVRDPQRLPSQK